MNFGPFITSAIMRIYDKSCAKVVVNNSLCKTVTLKSSLKQGCALSMLLYIICIEELIVRIENNNKILHGNLGRYYTYTKILEPVITQSLAYFWGVNSSGHRA